MSCDYLNPSGAEFYGLPLAGVGLQIDGHDSDGSAVENKCVLVTMPFAAHTRTHKLSSNRCERDSVSAVVM